MRTNENLTVVDWPIDDRLDPFFGIAQLQKSQIFGFKKKQTLKKLKSKQKSSEKINSVLKWPD